MTVRQIIESIRRELAPAVGDAEARAMADIIVEDVMGYTRTQLLLHDDYDLLPQTTGRMLRVATRVRQGEPLQYALGSALWRGRRFAVTPSVLIPRPETSQLVDMIVDDAAGRPDMRVLDIGTGSGCIAVSLALDLKFATVDAVDISPMALEVAASNAKALKARVRMVRADAFALDKTLKGTYDIIVSNPPYILPEEVESLDPRVIDHEPVSALVIPDADPIGIYRAIASYAASHLERGGRLYLEINPLCVDLLTTMLPQAGLDDVAVHRDYKGNNRFVTARRP